ncbi:hypothetical protein ACQP2X_39415 [Actinoplanes sp. CA-131856]
MNARHGRHPVDARRTLRPGRRHTAASPAPPPAVIRQDRQATRLGHSEQLLAGADPASLPTHPGLVRAALGHCDRLTDPAQRLAWAEYAYRAASAIWPADTGLTLQTMLLYAQTLSQNGRPADACLLHWDRLNILDELQDLHELTSGWRHLARTLHTVGYCEQATTAIEHSLTCWTNGFGPPGEGHRVLADYVVILAGCGRPGDAVHLIAAHPDLAPGPDKREVVARRIAGKACVHPPICRRHPTGRAPVTDHAALVGAWQRLLRYPPAALLALHRRPP